jgi:DNA-binding NarL/FixJ family response regulator
MDDSTIRVLIVDPEELVGDGLTKLLSGEPDLQVVGTATTLAEARLAVARLAPTVLLLQMNLPLDPDATTPRRRPHIPLDPLLAAIPRRADGQPASRIIIYTWWDHEDSYALSALQAGVAGWLYGEAPLDEWLRTIRSTARREADEAAASEILARLDPCMELRHHGWEVLKAPLPVAQSGAVDAVRPVDLQATREALRLVTQPEELLTSPHRLAAVLRLLGDGWEIYAPVTPPHPAYLAHRSVLAAPLPVLPPALLRVVHDAGWVSPLSDAATVERCYRITDAGRAALTRAAEWT